jgi:DNA topoisomerase-1
MSKSLVIVESPGKIDKISKILGNNYIVKASVGHIRNLNPKNLSIDVENNFKPEYIITKKSVVSDLKAAVKKCKEVILAADEDREGEAIAASLAEVLKLKNPKRILFNAITKNEILNALKNPTIIDQKMVDAQKARMILDKIVGYRLSPLLWNNIGHGLSAGRVQSVVVKIVIDRENKIEEFNSENNFKVSGIFLSDENEMNSNLYNLEKKSNNSFKGDIFKTKKDEDINKLFKVFSKCKFCVANIFDKKSLRNPSPPFITSSLQQEASYKLGFAPKRTMSVAQKLYEGGYITYMRTDSTSLSKEAMEDCKKYIKKEYGNKYYKERKYAKKTKNAQEAHEAIRPTDIKKRTASNEEQNRLYNLIWKRTVASQMSSAEINNKKIQIEISHKKKIPYYFETSIETIEFDGFLKVYNLSGPLTDSDNLPNTIPNTIPNKGDILNYKEIVGTEVYSKSIGRYNEASLVKELESKGIGRPSTFANVITKIQDKKYVERKDIMGEKKDIQIITLKKEKIICKTKEITLGKEKNKLIPTNTGRLVTEYLQKNFDDIMDYTFTANMEKLLDKIAEGKKTWLDVLNEFHGPFDDIYKKLYNSSPCPKKDDELLGSHPDLNREIYKTTTKFGPVVKMTGLTNKDTKYASLVKPLTLKNVTLEDAINLLRYPIDLGRYNDNIVQLQKGAHGFYIKYNSRNYSVESDKITLTDVIKIIQKKDNDIIKEVKDKSKVYIIKNGDYGPYISYKLGSKMNFKSIPKDIEPKEITIKEINNIIKMPKKKKSNYKSIKHNI